MMTLLELYELWLPVCVKLFGGETQEDRKLLDELLGVKEFDRYLQNKFHYEDVPMSEDVKSILVMILGPHGETMVKVWRIRKGLDVTEKDSDKIQDRNHQEAG